MHTVMLTCNGSICLYWSLCQRAVTKGLASLFSEEVGVSRNDLGQCLIFLVIWISFRALTLLTLLVGWQKGCLDGKTRAQQLLRWATVPEQIGSKSWEGLLCSFPCRELGPHLTQRRLSRGLPRYQVASQSIQLFGHSVHGPKIRGGVIWVPIYHNVAWAASCLHTKWYPDASSHLATIDMGQKLAGAAVPFFVGELGSI